MSILKFLSSLGLDGKSQKVYLTLLALADAPVSIIAKRAGLKRTTTHHQLENLAKLGLASSYTYKNTQRFIAENPNKLKDILQGKIALCEKYLPKLQKITSKERFVNLRLFEGVEGMRQIIEEELNCKEKIVRSLGSMKDLKKVEGGRISFTGRRLKKKIFSKCLRPQKDIFKEGWFENQEKELREARLLPEDFLVPGMIFIFDNKVTVITPEEEGVGFIIESQSLSKTVKSIFDILWEISEKTKK